LKENIQVAPNEQDKPTRAQKMAEHYGKKLDEIYSKPPAPRQIKHEESETLEMRLKRKAAMDKLATFKDLLG
jgi:hypothetical protein